MIQVFTFEAPELKTLIAEAYADGLATGLQRGKKEEKELPMSLKDLSEALEVSTRTVQKRVIEQRIKPRGKIGRCNAYFLSDFLQIKTS